MSPADSSLLIGKQTLRVVLCSHRGRVNADVRFWYVDKTTEQLRAGLRGLSVPAHALPWLIDSLQGLVDQLQGDGYMTVGDSPSHVRLHPAAYPLKDW